MTHVLKGVLSDGRFDIVASNFERGSNRTAIKAEKAGITCSTCVVVETESGLLARVAAWVTARNLPFLVTSIGMIVMLLWAGAFKMTRPGAKTV